MKTTFDRETFSELLKKAIGSRMQKDFASTIGISPAHLSRILNHRFNTPPSIETLKKIATHAENGVSYQDLLTACGYISDGESVGEITLPTESTPANKFVKATILTALESHNFSWELTNEPDDNLHYDLTIRINKEDRLKWYFKFLTQKSEEQMKKQFSSNYLSLLFQTFKDTDKLSLVTCSRKEFELYTTNLPANLNMNLSIILINESELDIQEERLLARAIPYKQALDHYFFNNLSQ